MTFEQSPYAAARSTQDNYTKNTSILLSALTLWYIPADQCISNTLSDPPICHNSSLVFNHYFLKVRVPMHTPSFTTPSGTFSGKWKLVDFCNIYVKSSFRRVKMSSLKNCHFWPSRIVLLEDYKIFCYIYNMVFWISILFMSKLQ